MKAVVIHRYGGPDVMVLEERPEPEVGPEDLLIEVRAASLNPIDFKLRERKVWPVIRPRFPLALGCDVAGVVRAVGRGVDRFAIGDEVCARLERDRMGGLAERVAAAARVVAPKARRASFEEAAALPLAGLTALQALRDVARLQPAQHVLIHAGAGGVGSFAIQIAKILGLRVTTTAGARNTELVRALGADDVIDHAAADAPQRLEEVRQRAPFDGVLDTLGGASEVRSLALVRPGGIVVGIAGMPDAGSALLPGWARPVVWMSTGARRRAIRRTGARFVSFFMRADAAQLAELGRWIDEGKLRSIIHGTFPLADFRAAFAALESGHARGKIVVTM
jgi:NADPH:quinone reductase-like Zn-dependent oxidoreductase